MRRLLLGAYAVELGILVFLFLIDLPESISSKVASLAGRIVLAVLLVAVFVGVPAWIKVLVERNRSTRLGLVLVGLGITGLAIVNYSFFVVPTIWSEYDHCWPPAVIEDNNCELGPL